MDPRSTNSCCRISCLQCRINIRQGTFPFPCPPPSRSEVDRSTWPDRDQPRKKSRVSRFQRGHFQWLHAVVGYQKVLSLNGSLRTAAKCERFQDDLASMLHGAACSQRCPSDLGSCSIDQRNKLSHPVKKLSKLVYCFSYIDAGCNDKLKG